MPLQTCRLHSEQLEHDQTNMYDYFKVEIYCHALFQFGQVVISERDTEGKGKCLCLVASKTLSKELAQQSINERNPLTSQDNQQNM